MFFKLFNLKLLFKLCENKIDAYHEMLIEN